MVEIRGLAAVAMLALLAWAPLARGQEPGVQPDSAGVAEVSTAPEGSAAAEASPAPQDPPVRVRSVRTILEPGVFYCLNPVESAGPWGSSSYYAQSRWMYELETGALFRVGEGSWIGSTLACTFRKHAVFGFRVRYSRRLTRGLTLDLAPGLRFDEALDSLGYFQGRTAPSLTLQAILSCDDYVSLCGQADFERRLGQSARPAVYGGARLGTRFGPLTLVACTIGLIVGSIALSSWAHGGW